MYDCLAHSLNHAPSVNQPLRFLKRFVAAEAIEWDRNHIKRLVLACRFDLAAIGFGDNRSPRSIRGLEGADGEPFVVRSAVSIGWHGAIYGRKGENGMTTISDQADAMVRANRNYRPAGATRRTYSTQEYEADMARAMRNVRFRPKADKRPFPSGTVSLSGGYLRITLCLCVELLGERGSYRRISKAPANITATIVAPPIALRFNAVPSVKIVHRSY